MSDDVAPYSPPPRAAAGKWLMVTLALVLLAGGAGTWIYQERKAREESEWQAVYQKPQKGLAPSGGKFFKQTVLINVPRFLQDDPRWGDNLLGPSATETLGSHGCAVSSCAMVFASYGVNTDPQRLNDYLKGNNGFTPQAWIEWSVAVGLDPERVEFLYEDNPSYELIDANLLTGNPVIVRLGYPPPRQTSHFVVICGKKGYDYLIMDPGSRGKTEAYPLAETGAKIDALRFFALKKKA
ncbi:MAG TPA: cysteine peptidase family C39 domain-containing protein [Verrucomicrobiales bacterium]|jgi:hypothetical protein|nr:cysteine peptidase family C39 domain-containing protein [Verrucomicrobiales bacterium]